MLKSLASAHVSLLTLQARTAARRQDETGKIAVWVTLGGLAIVGLTYLALREPKLKSTYSETWTTLP
jgi:hypothetical protein